MAVPFEANLERQTARVARAPTPSSDADAAAALHLRALACCLDSPLSEGNRVDVLACGGEGRAALLDAIDLAVDHINIEGESWLAGRDGEPLAQRLLARLRAGVGINLMCDDVMRSNTASHVEQLLGVGARVCQTKAVHPSWRWLHGIVQAHAPRRALVVIDGRIAFVGPTPPRGDGDVLWRIAGPAVGELQWLFVERWRRRAPAPMQVGRYFPALACVGTHCIGIAPAGSHVQAAMHTRALTAALDAARDRALLIGGQPPRRALRRALIAACRRGVDVHLLLRAEAVRGWATPAIGAMCDTLLRSGVHVHVLRAAARNTHASVIDGVWASIEASASDRLEAPPAAGDRVFVLDAEFGARAEAAFWSDVAQGCNTLREAAQRPGPLQRLDPHLVRRLGVSS